MADPQVLGPVDADHLGLRHGPEAYPYQQTQGLACTLGYTLLSTGGFGYTDLAFARLPPFGDPVDRGQPLLGPACRARR